MALDMSNTANNGVNWEKVYLCGWWPHDMDGSSNDRFEDVQTTYLKEKKKKKKKNYATQDTLECENRINEVEPHIKVNSLLSLKILSCLYSPHTISFWVCSRLVILR